MNRKILITGATGNVGEEVIRSLLSEGSTDSIIAGVRDIEKGKTQFAAYTNLEFRTFDFEQPQTYFSAFSNIDTLFLLRPPQISDVERVFKPLIAKAIEYGIRKFIFLSVQGADQMSFIPHAKIEQILLGSDVQYCFLRPSYFMQNLTTTLKDDIQKGCIVLPAGDAKFNWIDVANIGAIAATVINDFDRFANQAIDITGSENLSFSEVVSIINNNTGLHIQYKSPNLLSFYRYKRKQGVAPAMIMVMIMLHFLPRMQKPPAISNAYKTIVGCEPRKLAEFVRKNLLISLLCLITLCSCGSANRVQSVSLNGGDLRQRCVHPEKIRVLTLEGTLTVEDFQFMRDHMPFLDSLNIKNTHIVDNQGKRTNSIPKEAFSRQGSYDKKASALGVVVLPDSLISIDKFAFAWNSNLRKVVNVQPSLQTIGEGAFALTDVEWDPAWLNHLTHIGHAAFSGNKTIQGVLYIPSTCHITESSFSGCPISEYRIDPKHKSLMSDNGILYNKGSQPHSFGYNKDAEEHHLKYRGDQTVLLDYPSAKRDTLFVVPQSVKAIRRVANSHLKSIVLPLGLEYLDRLCLFGFKNLTRLDIPESVQYFNGAPYAEFENLEVLIMRHKTPPVFDPRCIKPQKQTIQLIVPEESVHLYRQSAIWGEFPNLSGWK